MSSYNRDGAIAYAAQWCNSHNPNYPYYDGTGGNTDCANFVSQCMYEGGGMPMKSTANLSSGYDVWYYYGSNNRSSSWTGAQSLRLFIKYNTAGYPRMGYTFLSNDQVGQLQKGDLVFKLAGSGNKSSRTATHVAMVSYVSGSTIYVYAHSSPKNNEPWVYTLNDTILCHFDGTIATGNGTPSSWQERYGTTTLQQSNTYNVYVKNLQEDLIALGYYCGSSGADGYFGSNTYTAVRSFQNDHSLTVDGLVGQNTKIALFQAVYS